MRRRRGGGRWLTGERKAALAILAVMLVAGTLFVVDQLQFCGIRCLSGIDDAADLNSVARQQGIVRLDVPPCEGTGATMPVTTWTAPGDVTALASTADGVLYAAGPDGAVWSTRVGDATGALSPWTPATAAVTVAGQVTAMAVLDTPQQLLVATAEPAEVVAFDASSGAVAHRWELPGGARPHELTTVGNRLVLIDSTGAVREASATGSGSWAELAELRAPGEFVGAADLLGGRSGGGGSRPVALVADPDGLRMIDVNTGRIRVPVTAGPGVDRPMSAEAAALVQSTELVAVEGGIVLVDAGRLRPTELRADWFGLGVGVASPVDGLPEPVSATGLVEGVAVADGSPSVRLVEAPGCAG